MNAGAVDQSIAVAMQSVTHAARPADTASCAASSQVSLVGPAGSLPTQAWNWSMQPPSRSVAATFREPAHHIMCQHEQRALIVHKAAFLVTVDAAVLTTRLEFGPPPRYSRSALLVIPMTARAEDQFPRP